MTASNENQDSVVDVRGYFNFLKALAIASIVSYHYFGYVLRTNFRVLDKGAISGIIDSNSGLSVAWALSFNIFNGIGFLMPYIFILVSGFGLYLSYLSKRRSWKVFYARRVYRVIPLYWLSLVLSYFFILRGLIDPKALIAHIFLVQTYTEYSMVFGALWFIGYIFQLYLLFPLLVRLFSNAYLKWALLASSLFITPAVKWIIVSAGFQPVGILPTEYLFYFLSGMVIAESFYNRTSLYRKVLNVPVSLFSLALSGALFYLSDSVISYTEMLWPLSVALMFTGFYCVYLLVRRVRYSDGIIGFASYITYPVFLFHMFVYIKVIEIALGLGYIGGFRSGLDAHLEWDGRLAAASVLVFVVIVMFSLTVQKSYDLFIRRYLLRY